jgi:DNA-binding transcriptional MocR family regulator
MVLQALHEKIVATLSVIGQFAPLPTQAALANFMNEGHFSSRLRRDVASSRALLQLMKNHSESDGQVRTVLLSIAIL